jgi:aromatic-L-amino-acid/L-tryptophan decarboxylase
VTDVPPVDLDLSGAEFRAAVEEVTDHLVRHLDGLATMPSCGDVEPDGITRELKEPHAPEEGSPLSALLLPLVDDWVPRSFGTPGPGYLAYIPGGGILPAALADLISDVTNRFTGIVQAAPALVRLEANALDWLREWMGFPDSARGVFTTGGSMANWNAIVAARERHLTPDEQRRGTMYISSETHHSVRKSARLAAIHPDRVRSVPVDGRFRMIPSELRSAIDADRRAGLLPFLVVSSAGTTNTGAVDPMAEIGAICRDERLWHHVDGAYGAVFHAVPELRPLLAGLSDADSVTLDPHKGLWLPYGTGALIVRDAAALRAAHASSAGYLPPPAGVELYDPAQYGPELSRAYPGLRVWLTVKMLGAARAPCGRRDRRGPRDRDRRSAGAVALRVPPDLAGSGARTGRRRDARACRRRHGPRPRDDHRLHGGGAFPGAGLCPVVPHAPGPDRRLRHGRAGGSRADPAEGERFRALGVTARL